MTALCHCLLSIILVTRLAFISASLVAAELSFASSTDAAPSPATMPQPLNVTSWAGQTILMISAHPDDIEACAGGLVSLLTVSVCWT